MNNVLRGVGVRPDLPLRAELVICQTLAHGDPQPCAADDVCNEFGFSAVEVHRDATLPLFVSIMKISLSLVCAEKHMDFLVRHVVTPLSERGSGKRYVSGSGKESIGTQMRYAVFEQLTGILRPKSLRACESAVARLKRQREDHSDANFTAPRPRISRPFPVTADVIAATSGAAIAVAAASLPCDELFDADGLFWSDLREDHHDFGCSPFSGSYDSTLHIYEDGSIDPVDWRSLDFD
jgi:hypothetical protein